MANLKKKAEKSEFVQRPKQTCVTLTNTSNTPRTIPIKGGDAFIHLEPLEIRACTHEETEYLQPFLRTQLCEQLVGAGLLKIAHVDQEVPTKVQTPQAPRELTEPVTVKETNLKVAANKDTTYNPNSGEPVQITDFVRFNGK